MQPPNALNTGNIFFLDGSRPVKYNINHHSIFQPAPARFEALEDYSVMRKRLTACACLTTIGLTLLTVLPAYARHILYSISRDDSQLRVVDPSTGETISSVPITLAGGIVLSGNGLATHPATGKLFALLTLVGQPGRQLVTINPVTGVATSIGNTGDQFAGLAFNSNGILFAVVGD